MTADELIAHKNENLANIRSCFKEDSHLTEWEIKFLGSIEGQLKANRALSERQQEILDDLIIKLAERYD